MTPRQTQKRAARSALALALALTFTTSRLLAEPNPAAPTPSTAPTPAPFPLWLDLGHSGLDKAKVRAAIEQELGAPVDLTDTADTPLRVTIDANQRVQVAFTTKSGESLSRTVDLPSDPERRVEVIALMVGNLTRNEAADLLLSLEAAKRSAANPPPAAPPPEPQSKSKSKDQSKPATAPNPDPLLRTRPAINLSLFHPLSLYRDADRRLLNLELGFAYSHVGGIQGAALSLGGLRVEQHVNGLAFGGVFSIVGGPLYGINYSLFYAENRGPSHGIVLSGLVANHQGPLTGVAIAGLVDIGTDVEGVDVAGIVTLSKRVHGATIAGIASIATGPVEGLNIAGVFASSQRLDGIGIAGVAQVSGDARVLQLSGVANVAGNVRGAAISGVGNITRDVNGLALSGVANVTRNVNGLALSGVANVARGDVHGAQIGLVNVATGEVSGAQIGLINLSKNGHIQAEAFATNFTPINAGIRFIGGYAYSELALGWDPSSQDNEYAAGLGAHIDVAPLTLEAGVHGSASQDAQTSEKPTRADLHYRARVGYRITSYLEPFVGGGARHGMYGIGVREVDPEFLVGVALF